MHGIKRITWALIAAGLVAAPAMAAEADDMKARVAELEQRVKELDKAVGNVPKTFNLVSKGEEDGTWRLPGSNTSVGVYGFVHVDAFRDMKGRTGDWAFEGGTIAIENDPSGLNSDTRKGKFNITAQVSRFGVKSHTPTDLGVLRTKLEFDFYKYGTLKSGYTNSYNPRLRHAYGELQGDYGTVLVGQTWSTFMNLDATPETVDFNGHASAQLARQPMVRYTTDLGAGGSLAVAIEDPATQIGFDVPQTNTSIDKRPDLIVAWNKSGVLGTISLSALSAEFGYDDNAGTKAKKSAYGYSAGGTLKLGAADTLMAIYTAGNGITRYVPAVNYNIESFVGGEIKLAKAKSVTAGWVHNWTETVRTNLSYGSTTIDDDYAVVDASANKKINSTFANVFWGIAQNTELGFEYASAKRELFSGESGKYSRLQASMHYTF